MASDISAKIGLDGLSSFKQTASMAIQQTKTLASEMKAMVAGFNAADKSEDALTKQNEILGRSLSQAKSNANLYSAELGKQVDKLNDLELAVHEVALEHGSGSVAASKAQAAFTRQAVEVGKLEQKYNNAQGDVNKFSREIESNEAQLNKANRKLNDSERSLGDLSKALDDSGDAADSAEKDVENFGDSINDAGKKSITFGDVLKANILSDIIMDGFRQLVSFAKEFAKEMIATAATVKAETAQFEQTFGRMQETATAAIGRVADEAGILDTRLNASATSIFAFAKASGADTAQAMNIMERALVVAADSAAYFDRSLEDVNQSLQSFLKGNYANDAALGVSATETTRNTKANELYGESFKKLSEAQKQITLLAMVEDANRLSGALGQASRESDGWENVVGNLKETWRQFQATVGTPFLESLIPIIQEVTTSFQGWANSIDWNKFSQTVTEIIKLIIDNGKAIIGVIGSVVGVLGGLSIVSTIVSGVKALGTVFAFLAANPIVLIIAAVVALVTALVTLWNTNEDFKNSILAAFEKIKTFLSSAISAIASFFTTTLPNAFQTALDWLKALPKNIIVAIASAIVGIERWGQDMARSALEAAKNVFNNIVNTIKAVPGQMIQIGKDIVQGIFNGISNATSWLMDKIKNWCGSILKGIKGFFGIRSPSTLFRDEIGKMLGLGVGDGFADSLPGVAKEMNRKLKGMTAELAATVPVMKAAVQDSYTTLPASTAPKAITNNLNPVFQITVNAPGARPSDTSTWTDAAKQITEQVMEALETLTQQKLRAQGV